ncbi:MAG: hypothetical protein WCH10_06785 [bacterium]
MIQKHKKAILVGETKLCIQCAEYLIDRKWEVIFIVSEDEEVISWAKNHLISILPLSQVNAVIDSSIYLFSIINPHIIPATIKQPCH